MKDYINEWLLLKIDKKTKECVGFKHHELKSKYSRYDIERIFAVFRESQDLYNFVICDDPHIEQLLRNLKSSDNMNPDKQYKRLDNLYRTLDRIGDEIENCKDDIYDVKEKILE